MEENISMQEAIERLEDAFCRAKDGELHRFLVEAIERPLLEKVLAKTGGNQSQAAKNWG